MAEEQMNKRIDWAKQISDALEKQMNRGESTSLDYTKSKLVVLEHNSALKNLLMERENLLSELTTLNGGVLPDLSGISLPEDFSVLAFDSLYEEKKKSAPALMIAQQEVKLSEKEYKLARSTMAPDLNVGYSGEWVGEESMQGMSVGIALPLWANKNKVKAARSSRVVASARFDEAENQYRTELKSLYDRLAMQNELMKSYQTEIDNYQGNDLLTKALQGGQITMVDYLNEQLEFMDVLDSKLEVEKEFYLLLAELYWY
jgi:outer membrane protein TolC